VGTNVGGMPELIRDQENGYLVAPGDPVGLASAMSRLSLASADELRQMGNRGRALIEEYDLRRVMDMWLKLAEESARARVPG
jgi:glycosyltransferase involved in cell wall biosynthesis